MTLRLIAIGAAAGLVMPPALAAGIAVLTKAEPSLSQTGKAIWYCTYIVENRETTIVRDSPCPPSLDEPLTSRP